MINYCMYGKRIFECPTDCHIEERKKGFFRIVWRNADHNMKVYFFYTTRHSRIKATRIQQNQANFNKEKRQILTFYCIQIPTKEKRKTDRKLTLKLRERIIFSSCFVDSRGATKKKSNFFYVCHTL